MPVTNEKFTLSFKLADIDEKWFNENEAKKETLLKESPRNDVATKKVHKFTVVKLV